MSVNRNKEYRSKLNTVGFIKWFRSRFNNKQRRNYTYLFFPDQLMRQTSIEQIFKEFDSDGSGGLSRSQVYSMFNGFGIPISIDNLNELYNSVQINLEELDCDMFKKCALSDQSNKTFRSIVNQLTKQSSNKQYMPHDFTNMIIYLVYLSKRQQLRKKIKSKINYQ